MTVTLVIVVHKYSCLVTPVPYRAAGLIYPGLLELLGYVLAISLAWLVYLEYEMWLIVTAWIGPTSGKGHVTVSFMGVRR
ncbi:hypothetical protein BDD12DRAFT_845443 [Trichophaea hybrida]|nr:hypothetical protein BDD12DRAFT_845443 [Trichophaea hybrida]